MAVGSAGAEAARGGSDVGGESADAGASAGGDSGGSSSGGSAGATCASGNCAEGAPGCPPSAPFCRRCQADKDCDANSAFALCDPDDGRCAECRLHGNDCGEGQVCHPLTLRCEQACTNVSDCTSDHNRPLCDPFGACVSCIAASDCKAFYGHANDQCFFGSCVECFNNEHCGSDRACIGLHCVTKH